MIQVTALGTNLISHPWSSMRQEGGTPWERFLPGTPWFYQEQRGHQAPLATKQDKIPSQAGCLAKRIHVEVWWSSRSSAQHWGGLWQPPSRALMDEDLADP